MAVKVHKTLGKNWFFGAKCVLFWIAAPYETIAKSITETYSNDFNAKNVFTDYGILIFQTINSVSSLKWLK